MLSPVRDLDHVVDMAKPKNLTALNNELTKINARRESAVANDDDSEKVPSPTREAAKVRRVSRFKVSVVTEPDQSKLERIEAEEAGSGSTPGSTPAGEEDFNKAKDFINDTMKNLQENLTNVGYKHGVQGMPSGSVVGFFLRFSIRFRCS